MEFREVLALERKLLTGAVSGILQDDMHISWDEEVKGILVLKNCS